MTAGIGIDSVDVARFAMWHQFKEPQLRKVFSEAEIRYSLSSSKLTAQRFAARFATKEAFFKALCAALPQDYRPFLMVCKALSVENDGNNIPHLSVNWNYLNLDQAGLTPLLSLTHTSSVATAIVFLQKFSD